MALQLTDLLEDERPWSAYAACKEADPELFFPGTDAEAAMAVRVCRSCAVRDECLEWALDTRMPYGVWGGLNERERRRLSRSIA